MRSDWIISGSLHAAVLLVGLVIATSSPTKDLSDYVPVTIVSKADLSRAALGQENAKRPHAARPLADKKGDTKTVKQLASKVGARTITSPAPPLPAPMPRPQPKPKPKPEKHHEHEAEHKAEHKADHKAEAKPEHKVDHKVGRKPEPKHDRKVVKKRDEFSPNQIAALLKKDEKKSRDKTHRENFKYDPNQIAELLDRRDPQRRAATASTRNATASLGAPNAAPQAELSQSEIDAFKQRLQQCWSPPAGASATNNTGLHVSLRVELRRDGTLAGTPAVVAGTPSPLGPALAESGERALELCQPFTMFKPDHYAQWKDMTLDFYPNMFDN